MTGEPTTPARESVAGVVGVGFGLLLIALCALYLLRVGPEEVEAQGVLDEDFELGALPFGLELNSALRFSSGELVVVLRDEREMGAPDPDELAAGPEEPTETDEELETGSSEKIDWSTLPEGELGTPPARVYLVRYPERAAGRALSRYFRNLDWKELSEIDAGGGRAIVEGGRVSWGDYAADYVRERRFGPGPSFRDTMRVNLALPGRYWIAFAIWPRDFAGSKQPLEEIMAALPPAPLEE